MKKDYTYDHSGNVMAIKEIKPEILPSLNTNSVKVCIDDAV